MAEPFHQDIFEVWVRILYEPCRPELLSGLSDPQQPTTVEVEQEDGSIIKEFSRYWPEGGGGPLTDRRLSPNSLVNRYAGLFSGRMKGLVQDQLGRGGAVNWGFSYGKTHGIYTASDGTIWVVEVSANGVVTTPLALCPFDPADTVDGFSASARSFPTNPASVFILADAATVAPAYDGKTALWSQCGWAFSASGAKAANVVIGEPGAYMVAYLYEIEITETTHTIAGESVQGPASASMTLIDSDFFYGDRGTHVRVPQYPNPAANIPQTLVSIDWWRGQTTPPSDDIDTPIHVYYDGESRIVSRYIANSNDSYTHTDGSTGTSRQVGFQTTVFPSVPTGFSVSGPFNEINQIPDPTTYYALPNSANFRQAVVLGGAIINQVRTGTWAERSNLTTDVLTIPFGDRESVYHARRTRDLSGGNGSATASYDWTTVSMKDVGTHDFEVLPESGCAANAVFDHPDPFFGNGKIIYDDEQPAPDPIPSGFGSSTRFGTLLQENPLTYWSPMSTGCGDMVGGETPTATGQAAFNKAVSIGTLDGALYEFFDVVASFLNAIQPGNERFVMRWVVRIRNISTGNVFPMSGASPESGLIRAIPAKYISAAPGGADKRALYTHSSQPINESDESFEFGVVLGNSAINLGIDEPLWEELRIYDPTGDTVQRILVVARDASAAARKVYSEEVYPTMGTPIGTLLAGDGTYPLASVTAPQVSWIGKP